MSEKYIVKVSVATRASWTSTVVSLKRVRVRPLTAHRESETLEEKSKLGRFSEIYRLG